MKNEQYDKIAKEYIDDPVHKALLEYVFKPTLLHYLPDLNGKTVIEFGCGSGPQTRLMARQGAQSVLGTDISVEMIKEAEAEQRKNPIEQIHYLVAGLATLGIQGEFDVAFAGFCFHYAKTVEELSKMFQVAADNLKPGGKLVAYNENSAIPTHEGVVYNVAAESLGELIDGVTIRRKHHKPDGSTYFFEHRHFEPETYERALSSAGFKTSLWQPFIVDPKANELVPNEPWNLLEENQYSISVLTAIKK